MHRYGDGSIGPYRGELDVGGRVLSYVDHGGTGLPLLALHDHAGCVDGLADLARELDPDWRIIAPTGAVTDEDASVALLDHLGLDRVVVLGRTTGTAHRLAARHPDRVTALIHEGAATDQAWLATDCPALRVPDLGELDPATFAKTIRAFLDSLDYPTPTRTSKELS